MPGPAPKPARIRELEGNRGKRPINHGPKTMPVIRSRPPSWLDEAAKKVWKAHAPEVERLGMLTLVDLAKLSAYCKCWVRYQEAEDKVDVEGTTYTTDTGFVRPNPNILIAQTYLKLANQIGSEFGFSPAARTRIQAPAQDKSENDFAEYD